MNRPAPNRQSAGGTPVYEESRTRTSARASSCRCRSTARTNRCCRARSSAVMTRPSRASSAGSAKRSANASQTWTSLGSSRRRGGAAGSRVTGERGCDTAVQCTASEIVRVNGRRWSPSRMLLRRAKGAGAGRWAAKTTTPGAQLRKRWGPASAGPIPSQRGSVTGPKPRAPRSTLHASGCTPRVPSQSSVPAVHSPIGTDSSQ